MSWARTEADFPDGNIPKPSRTQLLQLSLSPSQARTSLYALGTVYWDSPIGYFDLV